MLNKTHLYALADALKMTLNIEPVGITGKLEVAVEGTPLTCLTEVVASHHSEPESGVICRINGGHLYLWMRFLGSSATLILHIMDGTKMKCQPNRLTVKPSATSAALKEFFKGSCVKSYSRPRASTTWNEIVKTTDIS